MGDELVELVNKNGSLFKEKNGTEVKAIAVGEPHFEYTRYLESKPIAFSEEVPNDIDANAYIIGSYSGNLRGTDIKNQVWPIQYYKIIE